MLKSMTGYGRGELALHGRTITVEVRSVNNRYLDCNIRLPRAYACAEDGIQRAVKSAVSRGKVDVFVTVEQEAAEAVAVRVNEAMAAGYVAAFRSMTEQYHLAGEVSLDLIARMPDVVQVEKTPENLEELTEDLLAATQAALADFDAMRGREGQKLYEDLSQRLDTMEGFVAVVERRSPETVAAYRERLYARIQETLADRQIDEGRVLTEVAIFADKVAVAEETVRLTSHIAQFRTMLEGGQPIGRKLDFLIQEMNRETNTIGSKCNDLELSTVVVDMKAELEKIREQVQNVE
ncbi:MAG: YicC family protein [Clostridiales bacterium]|nr:YicC family protein [Clostridiales bacterium]